MQADLSKSIQPVKVMTTTNPKIVGESLVSTTGQVEAAPNIKLDIPRQQLQEVARKSPSLTGITILVDGKEVNLLKQLLQPEGISVEESLNRFIKQTVSKNADGKSLLLAEKEVKGLVDRIVASYKSNQQNSAVANRLESDLRIYLDNLFSQALEENKSDKELRRSEEKKNDLKLNISDLSKKFEAAVYEKALASNLGKSEQEIDGLNKKLADSRMALMLAVPDRADDVKALENAAIGAASSTAQKIKRVHDQIKEGISNGWDLALLMQTLSKSEYQQLSSYFKANNSGQHIWQFTESELWWNKEKGREAHSGACCIAAEYNPAGLAAKTADSAVEKLLKDPQKSKEEKLDFLKNKLEELSYHAAQNIAESAVNNQKSDLAKSTAAIKSNLDKKSDEIYIAIKSLGFETKDIKEAQARGFAAAISDTVRQEVQELAFKKSLEVSFYADSRNESLKAQATSSEEYWNKKLDEVKNNLGSLGIDRADLSKVFDAAKSQAESAGQARANVLTKSLLAFNAATREWGTKEESLIASLADSDNKLYSSFEISLLSQRHKTEYGTSLQEEIRDELSGKSRDRALAMFRSDNTGVFACDLKESTEKSFVFWGPDNQKFISNGSQYQSLSDDQKKIVDQELRVQGFLKEGQTFEGYCRAEFSGKSKTAAEAVFSKSVEQKQDNQAVLLAIQLNKHIGFFSDDYREMGKLLEPILLQANSGKIVGAVDPEMAKLVLKKYSELYGDNLLEDLNSDKKGAKWISALLSAKDTAHIDAVKYAYASEKKDLELAVSVFDRQTSAGRGQLEQILNLPDSKLRELKLSEYQAEMRTHIQAVEAKSKELFNKSLKELNVTVMGRARTEKITENCKILEEYKSYIFNEPAKLKADHYQALQSVTKMHLAMRNKSWGSDDAAVLDQLRGSSSEMLDLKKAFYKKLIGKDLVLDLDDQLKTRNADLGKFILQGEPKFEGDHYAYMQAILKRAERRLQLEERGWNLAKDEISDLRATYANMSADSKFILENRDKPLSQDDRVKYEKAIKRFFSDNEHFKIMADHNNQVQREKADFWVNAITTTTVIIVGVGLSVFSGGASLGLLAIAGYTTGASLAVRMAVKGIYYGSYDFKDDLQEDATVAVRDGALSLAGGVVFKGLGALKNAVFSRMSARWVALFDKGVQRGLASQVINNDGSREVLRQAVDKSKVLVKEYAGSGLYNAAGNKYVASGYAYLAEKALEKPYILDALEKAAMKTGKIAYFNRNAIEQSLSGLKIGTLRSVVKEMSSDIGKVSSNILLKEFDQTTKSFLSLYMSSNPAHLKYLFAAYNGVGTGSILGVAAQAMTLDAYNNQGDVGLFAKFVKSAGIGAVTGGVLGVGFSYVQSIFAGTLKVGSNVLKWDKNHKLSNTEYDNLYTERTWLGLGKLKYDTTALDKLKVEKAGNIFGGDLRIPRDAARDASWWRPTELWDRWKVHRINNLLTKAEASEELQAGYNIYDKWAKKIYASKEDLFKFKIDPLATSAAQVKEPETRMARWLLEKKVWWKVRVWGNYNLTEHQVGMAQEIAKKGTMSKFDLWQFRRASVVGQETNDQFAERYGFFVPSSSPVKTISYSETKPTVQIWGRDKWVRAEYQFSQKVDFIDDVVIGTRRAATPILGALVLSTSSPSVLPANAVDDFLNVQPRIEMVVKADSLHSNALTGEQLMTRMYESGQISRAQIDGALRNSVEVKANTVIKADAVRKVVEVKADTIVKKSDAFAKAAEVSRKNPDLQPGAAKSQINTNKAADSVKYQSVIQHNQQDPTFYKQMVNHNDQVIQEQRMIQQQMIQQQIVREQQANAQSSTKVQQKPTKKLIDDTLLFNPDFSALKDKKENEEKKTLVSRDKKSSDESTEEFDAKVRKAAEWHSRAMRKIMVADGAGKHKLLLQRLRDDGQYDTLSSSDVAGDVPEEPKAKV